jgi:hypothetical protein
MSLETSNVTLVDGSSVETGTASNPLRVNPAGAGLISGTVAVPTIVTTWSPAFALDGRMSAVVVMGFTSASITVQMSFDGGANWASTTKGKHATGGMIWSSGGVSLATNEALFVPLPPGVTDIRIGNSDPATSGDVFVLASFSPLPWLTSAGAYDQVQSGLSVTPMGAAVDGGTTLRRVNGDSSGRLRTIGFGDMSTGTLDNGAETVVDATAGGVEVLASNANRKCAIIQNVGNSNMRVGVSGVTATSGFQLVPGASAIFEPPFLPTGAIFAIREGGANTTALAQEIT